MNQGNNASGASFNGNRVGNAPMAPFGSTTPGASSRGSQPPPSPFIPGGTQPTSFTTPVAPRPSGRHTATPSSAIRALESSSNLSGGAFGIVAEIATNEVQQRSIHNSNRNRKRALEEAADFQEKAADFQAKAADLKAQLAVEEERDNKVQMDLLNQQRALCVQLANTPGYEELAKEALVQNLAQVEEYLDNDTSMPPTALFQPPRLPSIPGGTQPSSFTILIASRPSGRDTALSSSTRRIVDIINNNDLPAEALEIFAQFADNDFRHRSTQKSNRNRKRALEAMIEADKRASEAMIEADKRDNQARITRWSRDMDLCTQLAKLPGCKDLAKKMLGEKIIEADAYFDNDTPVLGNTLAT